MQTLRTYAPGGSALKRINEAGGQQGDKGEAVHGTNWTIELRYAMATRLCWQPKQCNHVAKLTPVDLSSCTVEQMIHCLHEALAQSLELLLAFLKA
eukprot:930446-Pelagomonas_calceolata.AAC.1